MNKGITVLFLLGALVASSWAGDFGVGVTVSNSGNGADLSSNGTSATANRNIFQFGVEAIVPVAPSWEVDPSVTYYQTTVKNDKAISGFDPDKTTQTQYTLGGKALYATPISEQFKVLIGASASYTFGDVTQPNVTWTQKNYSINLGVPVVAELRVIPNFAVRVQGSLAGVVFGETTYENGTYKGKYPNYSTSFGSSGIGIGAYFYF